MELRYKGVYCNLCSAHVGNVPINSPPREQVMFRQQLRQAHQDRGYCSPYSQQDADNKANGFGGTAYGYPD